MNREREGASLPILTGGSGSVGKTLSSNSKTRKKRKATAPAAPKEMGPQPEATQAEIRGKNFISLRPNTLLTNAKALIQIVFCNYLGKGG